MSCRFFRGAAEFRAWLQHHHQSEAALWLGFYKKESGQQQFSLTEATEEALCFGWIEGKVQSLDPQQYHVRFTPRKPGSVWSARNRERAEALLEAGLMEPAGAQAYRDRGPDPAEEPTALAAAYQKLLGTDQAAQAYFDAMPPSLKKQSVRWVMRAKQQATRDRRFQTLLACCQASERLPVFG